jgi:protein-S-isoprenylcysteine O-methyltransferase Ste14
MTFFDWLAAVILWANLPVPVFWLVLHTRVGYWRPRVRAAYLTAVLAAWGSATALLPMAATRLFAARRIPMPLRLAGLLLVVFDVCVILRVERELGAARLLGRAELAGEGEIKCDGSYARVRHPRYAAMLVSTLGACLMAAGGLLWLVAGLWAAAVLVMIRAEERELLTRFGPAYAAYRQRVPALFPGLK